MDRGSTRPATDVTELTDACISKIDWTYRFDEQGVGADAHLQAVLPGIVVVNVALVGAAWWVRRRAAGTPTAPRTAGLPR